MKDVCARSKPYREPTNQPVRAVCVECESGFVISVDEQQFLARIASEKRDGLWHMPKRAFPVDERGALVGRVICDEFGRRTFVS